MNEKPGFFSACIRAFFVPLFAVLGICAGITILVLALAGIDTALPDEADQIYNVNILPDEHNSRKALGKASPVILQMNISGTIGLLSLTQDKVRTLLLESREGDLKNNRVKGILLVIDSPGGAVFDSDGIYHALKQYKELYKVPVIAYVDGLCASGGFYIAMAADKVYASNVSLVGSVGVILTSFVNVSDVMEKLGVKSLTLSAGKGKDSMNPLRPWKMGEEDNYRAIVDYYYGEFVNIVVANRPTLARTALVNEYGAHVFPAPLAKAQGYIDEANATRQSALKELVKMAGLEKKDYQVVELKGKTRIAQLLRADLLWPFQVTHKLQLPGYNSDLKGPVLYLYSPGL